MHPYMSPDGTRAAFMAIRYPDGVPYGEIEGSNDQLWAVRRNMNSPPQITDLGNNEIDDDQVVLDVLVASDDTLSLVVQFDDYEDDAVTDTVYFLREDLGMGYDPNAHSFTWIPADSLVGKTFNVKFFVSTESGGVDALLTRVSVVSSRSTLAGSESQSIVSGVTMRNPSSGPFFVQTRTIPGLPAELGVYDIRGRRVYSKEGPSGTTLEWNGVDSGGSRVASGIYFYRVRIGGLVEEGKWVFLR